MGTAAADRSPKTTPSRRQARLARRVAAGGVPPRRRNLAWLLTLVGLPAETAWLLHGHTDLPLHIILFAYLLAAVLVAAIGGVGPAMAAGVAGFVLGNWYFTPPVRTWTIERIEDLFSLFTFLVVALAVGVLVGTANRRSAEARGARAQAEALAAMAAQGRTVPDFDTLVTRIVDVFPVAGVAVVDGAPPARTVIASAGLAPDDTDPAGTERFTLTGDTVLLVRDARLTGDDRRVLRAFASQAALAIERERWELEARAAEALAAADRLRTALLRSVSHDLRTPLATIKASVTSLLETGVAWTEEDTHEFLSTILGETERLDRIVGRLLDASRIQAGAVAAAMRPCDLGEIVAASLGGLGAGRSRVILDIPDELSVWTDGALLERVVANLVENAVTWSPAGEQVVVSARTGDDGKIEIRVADHGPGIPIEQREAVFQPFQRLGDARRGDGVGLGLTVARGLLEAIGGTLTVEDTPLGGTTMVIGLGADMPIPSVP